MEAVSSRGKQDGTATEGQANTTGCPEGGEERRGRRLMTERPCCLLFVAAFA